MTTVLKLGGSVVTEKDEPETVAHGTLQRVATAVAASADDLVVVHGGGSFGHHHAAAFGVSTTGGTTDSRAVRTIHAAMKRLNAAVVDAVADAGADAVPVHPFSAAVRDRDGDLELPSRQLEAMLEEGFLPVLHGDVVVHGGRGATILSGDELVVELARRLAADRVGVCSAVPGVYDADGAVVDHVESFADVADALGGSDATDVTGGMAAKVRELLALEASAYVFDVDGLDAFLRGGHPGTRVG